MTEREIARLKIVHYPDPVLRKRAAEVRKFEPWLAALGRRMLELMREAKGVGLAAPQVGVSIRLFVGNAVEDPSLDRIYINPELSLPEGGEKKDEGCLSLPDVTVPVERPTIMTLRAFDPQGQPFEMRTEGLLARVWQHEIDHLDGRLILDYMDTECEWTNRKAIKALEAEYKTSRRRA